MVGLLRPARVRRHSLARLQPCAASSPTHPRLRARPPSAAQARGRGQRRGREHRQRDAQGRVASLVWLAGRTALLGALPRASRTLHSIPLMRPCTPCPPTHQSGMEPLTERARNLTAVAEASVWGAGGGLGWAGSVGWQSGGWRAPGAALQRSLRRLLALPPPHMYPACACRRRCAPRARARRTRPRLASLPGGAGVQQAGHQAGEEGTQGLPHSCSAGCCWPMRRPAAVACAVPAQPAARSRRRRAPAASRPASCEQGGWQLWRRAAAHTQ